MAGFCPEPATSGLTVSNGGGVPDVASGVIQKWRGQKVEMFAAVLRMNQSQRLVSACAVSMEMPFRMAY